MRRICYSDWIRKMQAVSLKISDELGTFEVCNFPKITEELKE